MLSGNPAPPTKSPASKHSRGLSENRSVKLALLLFLALDRDDLRALGRVMPGRAIHARDDLVDRLHAGSTTKVQSGDFSIRDFFVLRLASPNHELLAVGRAVVARAANAFLAVSSSFALTVTEPASLSHSTDAPSTFLTAASKAVRPIFSLGFAALCVGSKKRASDWQRPWTWAAAN